MVVPHEGDVSHEGGVKNVPVVLIVVSHIYMRVLECRKVYFFWSLITHNVYRKVLFVSVVVITRHI